MRYVLVIGMWAISCLVKAQQPTVPNLVEAFKQLPEKPQVIAISGKGYKAPKGGHLQGIQVIQLGAVKYFLLTGSSSSYSYYVEVDGNNKKVIKLEKLLDAPYRHAGGLQVAGNKWAVGVEDNVVKDKSRVMVLERKGAATKVLTTKQREGGYKRSTAGATAFFEINADEEYYLAAVADWDSRHIDFYYGVMEHGARLDSATTFAVPDTLPWCAYQNINLLNDTTGQLYLVGLGKGDKGNRADVFALTITDGVVNLQHRLTRYFVSSKGTGFRYGAGVSTHTGKLALFTCQRLLRRNGAINVWE